MRRARTPQQETVLLFAGEQSSGAPVLEEVPVKPCNRANHYKVLASPGLVLGIAAEDVIELVSRETGEFRVISRGGNLCIQVFCASGVDRLIAGVIQRIAALGGRLDGKTHKQAVFTIPVTVGFPETEKVLNEMVASHPDCEWYYGNVYDSDGITPLNWWAVLH